MKAVFVATSGSYSSYQVRAAFSTREKAEEYAEHLHDGCVDEYTLDKCEKFPRWRLAYEVRMLPNGDIDWVRRAKELGVEFPDEGERWPSAFVHEDFVDFTMWARDEDHAIKIASDIRRQMIATGLPESWPAEPPSAKKEYEELRKKRSNEGVTDKELERMHELACELGLIHPEDIKKS